MANQWNMNEFRLWSRFQNNSTHRVSTTRLKNSLIKQLRKEADLPFYLDRIFIDTIPINEKNIVKLMKKARKKGLTINNYSKKETWEFIPKWKRWRVVR